MCILGRCARSRIGRATRSECESRGNDSDTTADRRSGWLVAVAHRRTRWPPFRYRPWRWRCARCWQLCRLSGMRLAKKIYPYTITSQLFGYWQFAFFLIQSSRQHTRCLSMCSGRKFGSYSKRCGSRLTGDWRRPLLHSDHSGLMRPQKAGPEMPSYVHHSSQLTASRTTRARLQIHIAGN